MISSETKDKILAAASIVDVIGEYVTLKKKGVNYVGCCPFHNEKTASFTVSPSKGIFKCFGCGKGGDVIEFVKESESITWYEAAKNLGARYHIIVESKEVTPEEKIKADRRESLKVAHEWAAKYFQAQLQDPGAKQYLLDRKVSKDILDRFRIGFAHDSWNTLLTEARKAGYKDDILLDSSLIGKNEKGNVFDWFRGRIVLPFFDLSGNVIGFTGRIIKADDKSSKYQNSKDTELFSKGRVLFGLYQAKKAIAQKDECYLVEGNFDVTSMHQAGIENTVAGSGTALTKEQIALIRRFTNNITVIYDADPAGIKASFRNIDLLLEADMSVRAIALPEGEDPDSLAKKLTPKDLEKFLETNRKDFITFKYEILKAEVDKDPLKAAEFQKEILSSISIIGDSVARDAYKRQCIKTFGFDIQVVNEFLKKLPSKKENKEDIKPGWISLDWASETIKENNEVFITADLQEMYKYWSKEIKNVISYKGRINYSQIQELNRLTNEIIFLDKIEKLYDEKDNLTENIEFCKALYSFGFNVKIAEHEDYFPDNEDPISFIEYYFHLAGEYVTSGDALFDSAKRDKAIEDAAELLASSKNNTTIQVNAKAFAKKLDVKEAAFFKILKPYLDKKKSKLSLQNDISEDSIDFHPDRLPDYVDRESYNRWGYFPYENSKGEKVRYVFRTENGALQVVGNFYIEPLFHIKDPDPNKNKRVIKVNNAEQCRSYYVEMASSAMIDFAQFKKVLFNEGGNIFTRGKAQHHETILASIAKDFPECYELNVFGQQHEGFWAFTNAIFAENQISYMNDLGLANFKDKTYYSPAFSKIFSGLRKDNDKYENDRYFVYRETSDTTFEEWARLMNDVYKLNHNGKWALIFSIMAAFRSIIYQIDRLFTAPFFIGPTESGKSQIAISIRSLYMDRETPLFNLNSGTDAAFFSTMERYRDVPVIFEEYNDVMISDIKFQGLKAAVYDGEGKQKKKDATSKDIDVSKVNAVPVLLGQEGPERDDGALGNRCVLCHVPHKSEWTEEEATLFRRLKEKEKAGLSNILIEILKQRDVVSNNFQKVQRSVFKELKEDISKSGQSYQTRILNTVSLFAALCKLWEDHVKSLKLPFTYKEFFEVAKAKIIYQSEAITSTNRVSIFFDTIELLLNKPNGIRQGKEFKIEKVKKLTVMHNRTETSERVFDVETKVLFLRINILHAMYADIRKAEALKLNNLMNYLKDHPSYIGTVKSTRFAWTEIDKQYDQHAGRVTEMAREAMVNTSAVVFKYDELKDIIDLEKYGDFPPAVPTNLNGHSVEVTTDAPEAEQKQMEFISPAETAPEDLPF